MAVNKSLVFTITAKDGDVLKAFGRVGKAATKEMKAASDAMEDTRTAGKKMADALSAVADDLDTEFRGMESASSKLASSLGEDFDKGEAAVRGFVQDLRRSGLTFEEIEADADELALAIKKLDDISLKKVSTEADGVAASARRVGDETDRSRGVMANFMGNAVQDLPGVSGAFGAVNVAVGQFAEYATEGGIAIKGLLLAAAPMAALAVAIPLLSGAIGGLGEKKEELAKRSLEVGDALGEETQALIDNADASDAAAISSAALSAALGNTGEDGEKLRRTMVMLGLSTADISKWTLRMATDTANTSKALLEMNGIRGEEARLIANAIARGDDWNDILSEYGKQVGGLTYEQKAWLESNKTLIMSVEELNDQAEKFGADTAYREAILDVTAAYGDAGEAALDLAEKQTGLKRTGDDLAPLYEAMVGNLLASGAAAEESGGKVKQWGDIFMESSERSAKAAEEATRRVELAWQQMMGVLDAEDAMWALEDAFTQVGDSAVAAWDAASKGSKDAAGLFRQNKQDINDLKQEVIKYGKEILGLPPERVTDILALIDQGKLDVAKAQLAALEKNRTATVTVFLKTVGSVPRAIYDDKGNIIGFRAKGGPVQAGKPYIVGEQGPELMVPNQSGTIIPNSALAPSAPAYTGNVGGDTIIVNMPNFIGTRDQVVDWMHEALLVKGRRNGGLGFT